MKIAHLTSVHPRYDTRIFIKQCCSLASQGHDVFLLVADGLGDETKSGVVIRDVGASAGRLNRILRTTRRIYRAAIELDADVYHLHDPELLPTGLKLKKRGKAVIFDSHEDVPKQLLAKPYLGQTRLRLLAFLYARFERYACRRLDGIVTATPAIGEKFRAINERTTVVNNFPLLDELQSEVSWDSKENAICYVGTISSARGIREIVDAMAKVRPTTRLFLAGKFVEKDVEADVRTMPGWAKVDELGFVDRHELQRLLSKSIAGLVTLHPTPNHMESHPIKMFEYMSAGIPVIASDFPLWRKIIEDADCGYCVDPLDAREITSRIDELTARPDVARRLGANGREAVVGRYNWQIEEKKLLDFYASLG